MSSSLLKALGTKFVLPAATFLGVMTASAQKQNRHTYQQRRMPDSITVRTYDYTKPKDTLYRFSSFSLGVGYAPLVGNSSQNLKPLVLEANIKAGWQTKNGTRWSIGVQNKFFFGGNMQGPNTIPANEFGYVPPQAELTHTKNMLALGSAEVSTPIFGKKAKTYFDFGLNLLTMQSFDQRKGDGVRPDNDMTTGFSIGLHHDLTKNLQLAATFNGNLSPGDTYGDGSNTGGLLYGSLGLKMTLDKLRMVKVPTVTRERVPYTRGMKLTREIR